MAEQNQNLAPGRGDEPARYGKPKTPQQMAAGLRTQNVNAQVDQVVDMMRVNVENVILRDVKLSEMEDRATALEEGASQFEQHAGALKNKACMKNMKLMIIMGVIGFVGLLFIGTQVGLF